MATRIHHLNCATMLPRGTLGGRVGPRRFVTHCLLVEFDDRLLLVDTGFGSGDLAEPTRLGPMRWLTRPVLDGHETARAQVVALGYDPHAVTDITLTHLDPDHAGGLVDFPQARVHVFTDELAAAQNPTWRESQRYVPGQWAHGPRWVEHDVLGEVWEGFRAVQALGDDVLLVPLRGHTRGHCGVAVRRPGGGWFLAAGDSYFSALDVVVPPSPPPMLVAFQRLAAVDDTLRRHNQERVRELAATRAGDVRVFCAHDAGEYDALAGVTH